MRERALQTSRILPFFIILAIPLIAYWNLIATTQQIAAIDDLVAKLQVKRDLHQRETKVPAIYCGQQFLHAHMNGETLPKHHRRIERSATWHRVDRRLSVLTSSRKRKLHESNLWLARVFSTSSAAALCMIALFVFTYISYRNRRQFSFVLQPNA